MMPTQYMVSWSIIMIIAISIWRLRSFAQVFVVSAVTAIVLLISISLFMHLATTAGADYSYAFSDPSYYLSKGPLGWMALLVVPCGWLGPMIGLQMVERWSRQYQNA